MATADRSGKGWRARWKGPDGSLPAYPSKSGFRTKREAIEYGEDQEAAIRAASYIDPKLLETTVDEWWERWFPIQDHLRPKSIETYRQNYNKHIKPRWGGARMSSVLPITIQEYRSELRKTYAENTVTVIMTILRDLFDDAALNRIIHFSPFPKTPRRGARRNAAAPPDAKPKREGIVVTLSTLDAICARLKPADALLVQTAFWTGMRWSEVAAMRRRFLHLEHEDGLVERGGYYVIDPAAGAVHEDVHSRRFFGPPKSGAPGRLAPEYPPGRIVDLPPFLTEMIRQHLATLVTPTLWPNAQEEREDWAEHHDLVFPNRNGAPRQYDNWNGLWRRVCDGWPASPRKSAAEAIITGLRLHDCKHSHGAMMDDLGIHSVMRDYRLGHATPGTRGVYSRPTLQMRLSLINGLQHTWDAHYGGDYDGRAAAA